MKSSFAVRKLARSDIEQLRSLIATRDGIDEEEINRRVALVEWAAFNNPHANGEATYFVAEQKGKVIAHIGRMPSLFSLEGKQVKGYFVHDLYVHPENRDGGNGLLLSVALYKATRERSDSFCTLLWTTQLNLEIQRKLGYVEGHFKNYVKLLRTEPVVKRFCSSDGVAKVLSLVPNFLLSAIDAVLVKLCSRRARIVPVEQFDSRFDALNDRISGRLGIHSVKNAEILNWRYAKRPFHHYRIYAAVRGDEVVGYIVVTVQTGRESAVSNGIIVDLMADPDDKNTVSALLAAAVKFCRGRRADVIECTTTQPEFEAILPKYLFLNKPTWRTPLMLGNLEKCPPGKSVVPDSRQWHITIGESDGFMFCDIRWK